MISHVSLLETAHRTTVLLIDDDHEQRKYWSEALRDTPFHYLVLEAETGEAGLHLYREQPVDCVVLDLDMPESGFFTLVRLVPDCERPQVPVVIFTQLVQPSLFDLVKRYGAYACLVKQYSSAEDLANTIQQAMASVKATQTWHA